MLLIDCPYCGARPEIEFRCGGEAHITRPAPEAARDDESFAQFLYFRRNTKGMLAENWWHVHGCQRWFHALRDTQTDAFAATYKIGATPPDLPGSAS
ncbi:MAG: sarcosine oxidase subunit delta [Hyphomicrobiales bacterium]|nr:sarcosine oxidase subunit delta [Hyphomicrobiales bacterium]MDE2115832.1 sarcosine oxidase subunit delta [Hyphomicrobiales bacterium]